MTTYIFQATNLGPKMGLLVRLMTFDRKIIAEAHMPSGFPEQKDLPPSFGNQILLGRACQKWADKYPWATMDELRISAGVKPPTEMLVELN